MKNFFFIVVILCFAIQFVQLFFKLSQGSHRRIYWSCASVAAPSGFIMAYPNWKDGMWLVVIILGAMIVAAYAYTPYIKIRGKIYALTVQDSQPDSEDTSAGESTDPEYDPAPDAYSGILTASKLWWMLVGLSVICTINLYIFIESRGEDWVSGAVAVFLFFLAVGAGLGDGSWGYRIARGQYIQFTLVSLITAGTFTVIYLITYYTAKRWPLRRNQSMEYRAHPRHQKNYP